MIPPEQGRTNDVDGAAFPDDFRDFIRALNAHGVEYLLVGGYAVGMYGHVRATTDIDFFYHRTPENVARLVAAMTTFGAPLDVIDPDHLATVDGVTAFGAPPTRIDLLASISGVTFEQAQADAVAVDIAGDTLRVIGLAALRINKQASGRKRDREDLKRLPVAPTPVERSAPGGKRGGASRSPRTDRH
jgi:predicted nucleotidyltransferase